jgi:phage terminase small subunit
LLMALTLKQRAFVDAVLAGKSNREAAVMAGYSAKTASAAGARLAKLPDVLAIINVRVKEMAKAESTPAKPLDPADFDLKPDAPIVWTDPMSFLRAVMNHKHSDLKYRIDAAKAMLPYEYAKPGELGKKTEAEQLSLVAEKGSSWDGLLQ